MSQWVGIEAEAVSRPAAGAGSVGHPRPRPRPSDPVLRRAERLVLGSIDGAAHVLQRRARDVLLGSALFMVPMLAIGVWLSVVAYDDFDRFDGLFSDRGYIGAETGSLFMALTLQSLTAHLVGAYAAAYLIRHRLVGNATIGGAAGAVVRRLPHLVLTWALTHWWAVLLLLGLLNADAAALAGLLFVLAPVMALGSAAALFVAPVMMAEKVGLSSLGRGWRLARSRFGACWGFVLAVGLLGAVLTACITWLPAGAEATGLVTFGRVRWLVQGVASQIAALVVMPFAALAAAEFYLQVRIHAEGVDIVMAADRAFGARS